MLEQLTVNYLTSLTYIALVMIPVISSIGFPFSEELFLLGTGYLIFAGIVNPYWALLLCLVGVIAGDNSGFWVGRHGGRILERLLPERKRKRAQRFFYNHGPKAVFFARFLIGPRFFIPLIAGASKMCWRRFFVYNAAGAVITVPIYVFIGYFVGLNLEQIISITHQLNDIVVFSLLIIAAAIVLYVCFFRKQVRHKIREGNYLDLWLEQDEPYQVVTFGDPKSRAQKFIAKLRKQDGKVQVLVSHVQHGCVKRYTRLKNWISLRKYNALIKRFAKKSKPVIEGWD